MKLKQAGTLGTLLLKSIGAGYSAVNIAGRNDKIQILEFAPLGDKSHLIVVGEKSDVQNFVVGLRTTDIERSLIIEGIEEQMLLSYLGQNNSKFQNFALIFESQFVGDLFVHAKECVGLDLQIVDFRVQRMNGSNCYLILTGTEPSRVKNYAQDLKRENVRITFIENISEGFRSYFDMP